jgi:hypothetical protein
MNLESGGFRQSWREWNLVIVREKIRAGVSAEGPRNPGLSCPPPQ